MPPSVCLCVLCPHWFHRCRWQSNARVEGWGCSRVYGGICLIGWGRQGKGEEESGRKTVLKNSPGQPFVFPFFNVYFSWAHSITFIFLLLRYFALPSNCFNRLSGGDGDKICIALLSGTCWKYFRCNSRCFVGIFLNHYHDSRRCWKEHLTQFWTYFFCTY